MRFNAGPHPHLPRAGKMCAEHRKIMHTATMPPQPESILTESLH